MTPLSTVLVANRGEIACRIIRTLRTRGIRAVAVYSDADTDAAHVHAADVALRLGPTPAAESYLAGDRVIEAAKAAGADAIHPGYGFLSENAAFARRCAEEGIVFVGPSPEAMEAMGDKIRAKTTVEAAGVAVVPGVHEPGLDDEALTTAAAAIGYPLLVKASAGGGGKGMRVVRAHDDLAAALTAARREAAGAFGSDALLLERYVEAPRHIEVQVLADTHGTCVALGERECSLQRRHQKVVEECPSPLLGEATREAIGRAAVAVAEACGYVGAGTVEFIVSGDAPDEFFFLEMNTRLQVEHPVTELVYGLDLVDWQLRVAAGQSLSADVIEAAPDGHAVEARVYAEDPRRGFLPTGGTVLVEDRPTGPGGRVDSGLRAGTRVGSQYDPMLAKVIAWGPDRPTALARLRRLLDGYRLLGVPSNLDFLRGLLDDPDVRAGTLDTGLIERRVDELTAGRVDDAVLAAAGLVRALGLRRGGAHRDPVAVADGWRVGARASMGARLEVGGEVFDVAVHGAPADAEVTIADGPPRPAAAELDGTMLHVWLDGTHHAFGYAWDGAVVWLQAPGLGTWAITEVDELRAARGAAGAGLAGPLVAPMPGSVAAVEIAEGDEVAAGQTLVVVEAMKMEHPITAPHDGVVATLHVRAGQQVAMDEPLVEVEPTDAG